MVAPPLDPRYPRLPPARLENARVLTDRFDLLLRLPKAALVLAVGAGAVEMTRYIQEICQPAELIAVDAFDLLGRPARSAEIVYLDSGRDYAEVARDLAAALRVVTPDGWIVLNGYAAGEPGGSDGPWGVIQAVHAFMVQADYEMAYLALGPGMVCHVALRRIGVAQSILSVQQENAALLATLQGMRALTSCRVTAPLRAVLSWVGRKG
jgi:hypothetical protein